MKISNQFHEKLKNENIEFVYICIDSDFEQCKSFVNKEKIFGKHYYLNKEQSKKIRKDLSIDAIPFYLILDTDGEKVHQGNDLKPSSDDTYEKIIKLKNTGA